MKNNKTKNYIICGVIFLTIIAVVIAGFLLLRKDNNTPNVNGPTNDFVNNSNSNNHISSNDEILTAGEYILTMLGASHKDRQIATMLEPWFRWDNTTNVYSSLIGEKFLSEYNIASTANGVVSVPNNTKRVFLFITYDDETINGYIEDYLLLASRAKDAGAYDLYVVNTNFDTMDSFIQKDLGYVQNKQTEEIIKFFETLPDNFLLYVGEDNTIEFISSVQSAYSTSEMAAYVFGTDIPCHEIMTSLKPYALDFENAYKEYLVKKEMGNVSSIDSIDAFNSQNNYEFIPVDTMNLTDIFNGISIVKNTVSFGDNILRYQGHKVDSENDIYHIHQTYKIDKQLIDASNYKYLNVIEDSTIELKVYGNNKDEIFAIEFMKGNIKIGVISTTTTFTLEQAKLMASGF